MNAASSHHRSLDHLVLPVTGLEIARARLTQLGFTVAPDGVHPFGTANCCTFFDDGTFIEPLALADELIAGESALSGNTFVRHFRDYQTRNGPDGFSALVFKSNDAVSDHFDYRKKEISKGEVLTFARDFTTPDGKRDRAEFRLAFASVEAAPDCLLFACERVAVPKVDRTALLNHPNGAIGILRAYLSAPAFEPLVGLLEGASGAVSETRPDGSLALRVGGFELRVVSPQKLASDFGIEPGQSGNAHFCAVVYSVANIAATENQLVKTDVVFRVVGDRLVVPPQHGQGATFIFMSSDAA